MVAHPVEKEEHAPGCKGMRIVFQEVQKKFEVPGSWGMGIWQEVRSEEPHV